MTRLTVLVIGASGQIGRRVCRELLGRDVAVRAMTHSQDGADRLAALGVADVVEADLSVPASLPPAFDGVHRVMQITRAIRQPRQEIDAVDAARNAGVERIVKLSSEILYYTWDEVGDGGRAEPADMVTALHGPAEDRIRSSGIDHVMLRPTWFMSIDANPLAAPGFTAGQFVWPAGSAGLALVHPDDVAEVAAECLVTERVPDSPLRLTGPAELGPDRIAAGIGEAGGLPVVAVSPSLDEYELWLEGVAGMPRSARRIVEPYAGRGHAPVTDAIEKVLNRPARSFAEYIADRGRLLDEKDDRS